MDNLKRPSINWMTEGIALRDQVLPELLKDNLNGQPQEAKYQLNDWRDWLKRPSVNWMNEGKSKETASRGQVSTEWLKWKP